MRWGEIKDPVHGYILVTHLEKELIDTPEFQRLRRIRQLGAAHLTYPGAEHTRFSHSLGTMHVAGLMADRLVNRGWLERDEAVKVRVAALLHDVGHGPFSHIFEEVLMARRDLSHEDIGMRIIRETSVADVLKEYGLDPREISMLSVGRLECTKPYMNQVIASQFSSDIMDFILRDSYFTGVKYGNVDIDRLVDSVDVVDGKLAIDLAALSALESFVVARYELFKAVYFHRTVRAAAIMLVRAIEYADEELGFTEFKDVEEYLKLDDGYLMSSILGLERSSGRLGVAAKLCCMLRERKLLKCAYEKVLHVRDRFRIQLLERDRRRIEEEISELSGADRDYVLIDVSTAVSVPYYTAQGRPEDIPVFERTPSGKVRRMLSEYSPIVKPLIGYLDIVRVYSLPKDLEAVRRASLKIFGGETPASRFSY
ncbi:MAG: hypothetical protein DRJ43_05650 [Thermoprotei archaeon]|nr:MAG: hypothetical protein DRJ43_05650 [Thermoprotei archaeon]